MCDAGGLEKGFHRTLVLYNLSSSPEVLKDGLVF